MTISESIISLLIFVFSYVLPFMKWEIFVTPSSLREFIGIGPIVLLMALRFVSTLYKPLKDNKLMAFCNMLVTLFIIFYLYYKTTDATGYMSDGTAVYAHREYGFYVIIGCLIVYFVIVGLGMFLKKKEKKAE